MGTIAGQFFDLNLTMPKESSSFVTWEGRKVPLLYTPSGWRARKRSRHFSVDYPTGIHSLKAAQTAVKEHLEEEKAKGEKPKGKKTLADVVEAYKNIPKKAGQASETLSIYRLKAVVRVVTGKEMNQVLATEIDAKFWLAYIAKRQGRAVADLGARAKENNGINSAMRTSAAIFKKTLLPLYAELGIVFSPDVTVIQWLPKLKVPKPKANGEDLLKAWKLLKTSKFYMWQAIGLARFAGLRRKELNGLQRDWIEEDEGAIYIRICDRPEQNWYTKTGENYRAPVINAEIAQMLKDAPPGYIIDPDPKSTAGRKMSRYQWFMTRPQAWVKPFTGEAKKPLHRLRGLYLDEVAKLREDAEKARLAGIRAAASAAGHTTTKTTEDHYLSGGQ